MVCNKCGLESGDSPFCMYCGAPAQNNEVLQQKSTGKMKTVALVIAAIVLSAAVIAAAAFARFKTKMTPQDHAQKLLDTLNEAIVERDEDLFADVMTKNTCEYYDEQFGIEYFVEYVYETYLNDYGDNFVIESEIDSIEQLDDDEIQALIDDIESDYGFEEAIEDAYEVSYTDHVSGDDYEASEKCTCTIIYVDGEWYIFI